MAATERHIGPRTITARFETPASGIPRPHEGDLWCDLIKTMPRDETSELPPISPASPRHESWRAKSACGPPQEAPATTGRPFFTERRDLQSQNDHPWLSKYVTSQGNWHRPMTLEEYTKSQEERAREEDKRAKLAQMERDKRLRAEGRKQDGKLDKSSKKSIESMDMTQSDWEHLLADKLRKRHKASVKKVFDDADEDDSGELDFFEFFHAMEQLDVGKIPRHYAKKREPMFWVGDRVHREPMFQV